MSTGGELRYEVLVSDRAPVPDEDLPNGEAPTWAPLSHTVVYGPTSAALVDPPITQAQTAALADWIAARECTLEHIFITHWHGDHWLGTGQLLQRFPAAKVLAGRGTVERIRAALAAGTVPPPWPGLFPGQLPEAATHMPVEEMPADGILLDGHRLACVEVGHSDTDDSTVLHVESLGLVAAGDVVYNNVHQYVAEGPGGGLEAWHRALDTVAALKPQYVVAGHKDARRDDAPSNIDETHRYLDAAAGLLDAKPSRREFFQRMLELYPDRLNPFTIMLNARRLLED
jgi:glyoxylase-like metal-dependent hydrolase (beta-lactamase superfamily II)